MKENIKNKKNIIVKNLIDFKLKIVWAKKAILPAKQTIENDPVILLNWGLMLSILINIL